MTVTYQQYNDSLLQVASNETFFKYGRYRPDRMERI